MTDQRCGCRLTPDDIARDCGFPFDKAERLATYTGYRNKRITKREIEHLMGVSDSTTSRYETWFRSYPAAHLVPSCEMCLESAGLCICCPEPEAGCRVVRLPLYARDRIAIQKNGCWHWVGTIEPQGYGVAKCPGHKRASAHRFVYMQLVGAIGDGLTLDHQCHNRDLSCSGGRSCLHRRCVNPSHLEPASNWENVSRGRSLSALNLHKDACPQGHPYDQEDERGWRKCSRCMAAAKRHKRRREGIPERSPQPTCGRGHEYTEENTRWSNGRRFCKACARLRKEAAKQAKREADAWRPSALGVTATRVTPRQLVVLRSIATHIEVSGCAPSLREIGAAIGTPRGTSTVEHHLARLSEMGLVQRDPSAARGIQLLTTPGIDAMPLLWCGNCDQELPADHFCLDLQAASLARSISDALHGSPSDLDHP